MDGLALMITNSYQIKTIVNLDLQRPSLMSQKLETVISNIQIVAGKSYNMERKKIIFNLFALMPMSRSFKDPNMTILVIRMENL